LAQGCFGSFGKCTAKRLVKMLSQVNMKTKVKLGEQKAKQAPVDLMREDLAEQYTDLAEDDSLAAKKREAALLFSVAEGHMNTDEASDALKAAGDALKIFREIGDKVCEADSLRIIVDALRLQEILDGSLPQESINRAEAEMAGFKDSENKRGEACMHLCLADIKSLDLKGDENLESAVASASEALALFQELDDKKYIAETQISLANAHFMKGKADEVKSAAEEALDLFKEIGDVKGQAKALRCVALSHAIPENFEKALRYSKEAATLYKELGDSKSEAREMTVMAFWQNEQDQPAKALRLAQTALSMFRQIACSKTLECFALFLVCEAHVLKNQGKQALKAIKDGMAKFETSDTRAYALCHQIKLQVHLYNDELEEAAQVADEGLDLIRGMGNKKMELFHHHLYADVCLKQKSPDKAVKAMAEAVDLAQEMDDAEEEAVAKAVMSEIYRTKTDDVDKGLKAAEDARTLFRRAGLQSGEAFAMLGMAISQSTKGNNEKAVTTATEAQELYQEDGFLPGQSEAMRLLTDLYISDEKPDKALETAEERIDLWKECGNTREIARALQKLTEVHLSNEEIEMAEKSANEALDQVRKSVDRKLEAQILITMSEVQLANLIKQDPPGDKPSSAYISAREKAAKSSSEAVSFSGKVGDKALRAIAIFWRAHVYIWSGRAESGLHAANDAERLFHDLGDQSGECNALLVSVNPLLSLNKKDKALEVANKALEVARECEDFQCEDAALKMIDEIEGRNKVAPQMMMMEYQPQMQDMAAAGPTSVAAAPPKPRGLDPAVVKHKVLDMVKNVISSDDDIETDSPFMEAGMDSLSSVELVSQVAKEFQMALSPALIFDFPTVRAMVDHIVDESKAAIEGF